MNVKTLPKIIFIHVPKTAGQTLYLIIKRQYPLEEIMNFREGVGGSYPEFLKSSPDNRSRYWLLRGHIPIGLHEYIDEPCEYFTFLRDPIERTISHYYFLAREEVHPLKEKYGPDFISFKELLERGDDPLLFNCHTRQLSGVMYDVPPRGCTRKHLELAKQNLRDNIRVVGLTERFDESLILLQDAFGWQDIRYVSDNVSVGRPRREDLSAETIALVEEANQLDQELYAYGQELFEKQLIGREGEINSRVRQLQRANRLHNFIFALKQYSVRTFIKERWQ